MTNYRYKIKGEDIIVSYEEHQKILTGQEEGADMVYLRNGKLGVNPKKIDFFKETNLLTEEQEEEREKSLKLSEARDMEQPNPAMSAKVQEGKAELYKKMGWDKVL